MLLAASALLVGATGAHFLLVRWLIERESGDRLLLLLLGAEGALTAVLLGALAFHLHRLDHERRRHALIEALVEALSVPASIEETAASALSLLVEARVAPAGIVAAVSGETEEGHYRLAPLATAGTQRSWAAPTITPEHLPPMAMTTREQVTDDLWLLGMEITIGRRPWVARIPIARGDEHLGMLVLASRSRGWLGDRVLMRAIGTLLAAALDHGRQYQVAFERTRDLEEQNARRREFLYAIAHELRSPLTSIQAFAELLTSDSALVNGNSDLLLSSLSRGVDRLQTFVNDLLDLGKVEESGLRVRVAAIDVTGALRGAETILRPSFMAREQALSLDLPDGGLRAVGDERALEQVMLNLLSNANRFTPTRGAVSVRSWSADGRVRIEVQDSGPGIDPLDRQRVFEPFYRVHRAGAPEVPGSGLGLAVARRLTEMQGGRIWVEGREGVPGTCFCIELPSAEEPAAPAPSAPAAAAH